MWTSLLPVAVGGLIGIAGGLATGVCLERVKMAAERRNLTEAILGEIEAIAKVAERRRFIDGLKALIAEAKAGNDPSAIYFYQFSVRRNPFAVYDANLSRIGMLRAPSPRLITQFYAQVSSILEDIADMREGKLMARSRDESVQRLEQLLELFEETRELANQILAGRSK